jgi:hypothetical protein
MIHNGNVSALAHFEGMLWQYDFPEMPLAFNVGAGVGYFIQKYGVQPEVIFVNERDGNTGVTIAGVEVVPSGSVQERHCLIGIIVRPQAPTSTEGDAA